MNDATTRRRWNALGWAFLLGSAAGLRLLGIHETDIWTDEAFTLLVARSSWFDVLVRFPQVETNPPLHFALVKAWGVVSDAAVWHRLLSVIVGVSGVVFTTLWARRLDPSIGWAAGFLAASCPIFCHYSQEIRGYSLLYSATVSALYFAELDASGSRRGRWWPVAAAATVWTHYVGVFAVVAVVVYWLVRRRVLGSVSPIRWRRLGVLALLLSPGLFLVVPRVATTVAEGFPIRTPTWAGLPSLSRPLLGTAWVATWRGDPASELMEWAAVVVRGMLELSLGLAAGLPFFAGPRRIRRDAAATWLTAGVILASMIAMGLWVVPVLVPRTGAIALPPLMIALALGTSRSAASTCRRLAVAACSIVTIVWAGLWISAATGDAPRRSPDAKLFRFVSERIEPGDDVICFPSSLAWSTAYYLGDQLSAERLHYSNVSEFAEGSPLRIRPIGRNEDPHWFERVTTRLEERMNDGSHSAVWVLDCGLRSFGTPLRQELLDWIHPRYRAVGSHFVPGLWTFSATRFVPVDPVGGRP
ncbi:MAG: glycosyltransferase family 39 protein [Planctomycetes bacterium]|nr:glycosyltransferase family 39 protein [Planctomycetota bacterium]